MTRTAHRKTALLGAALAVGLFAGSAQPSTGVLPTAAAAKSNDAMRADQWTLDVFDTETTWRAARGDGVIVAVIDTGVKTSHPDLAGRIFRSKSFSKGSSSLKDERNHGTGVAGVIAANASNGQGVAGIAPDAKIMNLKVFPKSGRKDAKSKDAVKAIKYAVDNGAHIINLSFGTSDSSVKSYYVKSLKYAKDHNVLVVTGAGNNGAYGNPKFYPAANANSIAVGSVTWDLAKSGFSTTGPFVDVVAPGSVIRSLSSGKNGYNYQSGTSQAAPAVSGVLAQMIGRVGVAGPNGYIKRSSYSAAEIQKALFSTATDLGKPGRDKSYGRGLINPTKALNRVSPSSVFSTTPNTPMLLTYATSTASTGSRSYNFFTTQFTKTNISVRTRMNNKGGWTKSVQSLAWTKQPFVFSLSTGQAVCFRLQAETLQGRVSPWSPEKCDTRP